MRITSHDYDVTNMCLDARLFPHRQRCSWRHARIMILVPGVILNMHISVCFERIDKTLHRRQKEESDKIVVKCYNEYFVNASLCNYLCTRMLQQTRVSRITDIGKPIGISDVGNPISYVWNCQVDTQTTHILRRIKKICRFREWKSGIVDKTSGPQQGIPSHGQERPIFGQTDIPRHQTVGQSIEPDVYVGNRTNNGCVWYSYPTSHCGGRTISSREPNGEGTDLDQSQLWFWIRYSVSHNLLVSFM